MASDLFRLAVCGSETTTAAVANAINETVVHHLVDDATEHIAMVQLVAEQSSETVSGANHFVIAAGLPGGSWADVSISSSVQAQALAEERLVPWVVKWKQGRRAPRAQTAVLAEHDDSWASTAARLIGRLKHYTADMPILRIDHIGSTSVPDLPAKDLIDIQITIPQDLSSEVVARASAAAGFVHVEGDWHGKDRVGALHPEQVCVDADPGRPVNINIRSADRPVARDSLLFRDWLRANPNARDRYHHMKAEMMGRHIDEYGDSKEPFISAALDEAETWATNTRWSL